MSSEEYDEYEEYEVSDNSDENNDETETSNELNDSNTTDSDSDNDTDTEEEEEKVIYHTSVSNCELNKENIIISFNNKENPYTKKYPSISDRSREFKTYVDTHYVRTSPKKGIEYSEEELKEINNNNTNCTNLRVSMPPGSYIFDKYDEFLTFMASLVEDENIMKDTKQLIHNFNYGEKQCKVGPLLLDFDFNYTELTKGQTRIYNVEIINIICNLVNKVLITYFNIPIKYEINPLIFEKSMPTHKKSSDKEFNKDGFHIMYLLPLSIEEREFIYYEVLDRIIKVDIFNELPVINKYNDIFDKSTIYKNCWMMYGSTKTGGNYNDVIVFPMYKLTMSQNQFKLNSIKQLSIRQFQNTEEIEIKVKHLDYYNNILRKHNDNHNDNKQITQKQIYNTTEVKLLPENYVYSNIEVKKIEYARKLLSLIKKERADDYNDWLNICWALKTTHTALYDDFIKFSQQSSKYDINSCNVHWNRGKTIGNVCNIKTLEYFAEIDNSTKYYNLFRNENKELLINSLSNTANKIATYIVARVGNKFATISTNTQKGNDLYHYVNNIWEKSENGNPLLKIIHNDIENDYLNAYQMEIKRLDKIYKNMKYESESDDDSEFEDINISKSKNNKKIKEYLSNNNYCDNLIKRSKDKEKQNELKRKEFMKNKELSLKKDKKDLQKYKLVIDNLDNSICKNDKIIKSCYMLLERPHEDFRDLLDKNPYLIAFKNGIYDLSNYTFRTGRPEDYLTIRIRKYLYPDPSKEETRLSWESPVVKEVLDYFYSIQTKKENAEFLLRMLASCLLGTNKENKFYFFYGPGGNGKSWLFNLLRDVFDCYYTTASNTIITKSKGNASNASPELMALDKKRLVIMHETNKKDEIQSSTMKQLSGNDDFTARGLFQDQTVIKPQFKIVNSCNTLPGLDDIDEGTWRRIYKIGFDVKFIMKNLVPDDYVLKENERWAKPELEKRLQQKDFIQATMWVLLETYKDYDKNGLRPTADVINDTNKYKLSNDIYERFITEYYMKDDNDSEPLLLKNVYNKFKIFFNENNNGEKIPNQNQFKEHMEIKKYTINKMSGKWYIHNLLPIMDEGDSIKSNISCNTPAIDEIDKAFSELSPVKEKDALSTITK